MNDIKFLHAFNLVYGAGPTTLRLLRARFGTFEEAWRASEEKIRQAGVNESIAKEIGIKKQFLDPDKEINKLLRLGIWIMTDEDKNYPPLLKAINVPPPILYVRGKIPELKNPIAVVGSRKATSYGIEATKKITGGLARAGCEIISGLAMGIDTAAHSAALEENAVTIAVVGSGVDEDTIFPAANRILARKIVAKGGAVISEFPPETPPLKHHFPQRNRIISGISRAVFVAEAKEKSGALITANLALEQNKDVFALPGSVFSLYSAGPHALIQQGAVLVTSADTILSALEIDYNKETAVGAGEEMDEREKNILKVLSEPRTIDELTLETKYDPAFVATTVSFFELKGIIKKIGSSFVINEQSRVSCNPKKENIQDGQF